MSKQLQSFPVEPLDARIVKGLIEKMSSRKINADQANKDLSESVADYQEYMGRLGSQNGIDPADIPAYRINVAMNQLEPIPVAAPPKLPTKSPDADEPPAPAKSEPDPV